MDTDNSHLDTRSLLSGKPQPPVLERPDGGRLFVVYNGYRTLLGVCLVALLIIPAARDLVASFDRTLFTIGASALLFSAIPLAGKLGQLMRASTTGIFGLLIADITALTLVTSASGGILSGFSVLYLVTVAAAAVLLNIRILATLVAAIAVIAVLFDASWMVSRGEADLGMLLPAGILGSLLFAVSLLVQTMASRLALAEAQADEAESRAQALQQLNQQIISHMQTGILLVNSQGYVSPVNTAAQRLLNIDIAGVSHLGSISPELAHQFTDWYQGAKHQIHPFRVISDGPAMVANFVAIDEQGASDTLIFIEDYTPVTQFAQSLKLNSLSKLTASIAHEIRNPLAAISHAAQLLHESKTIDKADSILCDILVSNSERVSDIIDNVTEVSRRQAPKPVVFKIDDWLNSFLAEYESLRTDECQIERLPQADNAMVAMDPQHLKRVLTNLLDNGLRHSKEDSNRSVVRVETSLEQSAGLANITVVDYGFGVAESNLSRLFEPFFTTSSQGSGLGLYLCKELCEINGAGLIYQPTRNDESAFRVSLKLEEIA